MILLFSGSFIEALMRSESKSSNLSDTTQATNLKRLLKITPIWSSGILLNAAVATSTTLVVLQASSMNSTIIRSCFHLPAASIPTISLVFTALALSIFDYVLYPSWHNIIGRPLKPLQRSGVGHVFVFLGFLGLALVEVGHRYHLEIISAWWLVIPLALLGTGAAFYFPGGLTFHYQEFPKSLKSTSTAMPSVQVLIGFFLSKGFVNVVKHKTSWLLMNGDNVGLGRLDLVYGVLAIIVGVNFGYFLVCANFYKYNNIEDESVLVTQTCTIQK